MNTQQKMHYTTILNDVKEKRAVIERIKNPQTANVEEVKESADDLVMQLKKMGINNTADLKRYIQQNSRSVQNIAQHATPQNMGTAVAPGIFEQLKNMATSMAMMSGMSAGMRFITTSPFFQQLLRWAWSALKISAITAGIAAVAYFFVKVFIKIYKKIVDKAVETKITKQEPTREEILKVLNLKQILQETSTQDFYTEAMNPEKQTDLLDLLIKTTQDALDVLSIFAIGGFIWVSLTAALTPVMIAGLVGSTLWILLFFARNAMKRSLNAPYNKQNQNNVIRQIQTNAVPNPA